MSYESVTRHILIPGTKEYKDVETRFKESLPSSTIIQIERIQNRRKKMTFSSTSSEFHQIFRLVPSIRCSQR